MIFMPDPPGLEGRRGWQPCPALFGQRYTTGDALFLGVVIVITAISVFSRGKLMQPVLHRTPVAISRCISEKQPCTPYRLCGW